MGRDVGGAGEHWLNVVCQNTEQSLYSPSRTMGHNGSPRKLLWPFPSASRRRRFSRSDAAALIVPGSRQAQEPAAVHCEPGCSPSLVLVNGLGRFTRAREETLLTVANPRQHRLNPSQLPPAPSRPVGLIANMAAPPVEPWAGVRALRSGSLCGPAVPADEVRRPEFVLVHPPRA